MRIPILFLVMLFSLSAYSQQDRDTVLSRCPLFIVDTATSNNYFIEARPATLKVYRVKGNLTVVIEQKDQFFTMFFKDKRLKSSKYKISFNPDSRYELAAKYSFRSGDQVAYIDVASGVVEVSFDKIKKLWHLKVNGKIPNPGVGSNLYFMVKADLTLK